VIVIRRIERDREIVCFAHLLRMRALFSEKYNIPPQDLFMCIYIRKFMAGGAFHKSTGTPHLHLLPRIWNSLFSREASADISRESVLMGGQKKDGSQARPGQPRPGSSRPGKEQEKESERVKKGKTKGLLTPLLLTQLEFLSPCSQKACLFIIPPTLVCFA
jgi:hypothetical protein